MTIQKIAKYAGWFTGFVCLFFGLIELAFCCYVCWADDRTKIKVIDCAVMIPQGLILIWLGGRKIFIAKRTV